jgi:GNAT superfamily N-acetyltransferase
MNERFEANGGDASKLKLYASNFSVRSFADEGSRCLATIHPDDPTAGAVGDWVGNQRVRRHAEDWLRDQGCNVARAPMELCSFFGHRVCLGPFDDLPFPLEPTEPADRWLDAGYESAAEYVSIVADSDRQIARARERASALSAQGWTVAALPDVPTIGDASFKELIRTFTSVYNAAYANRFACHPLPERVLQAWYASCRNLLVPSLTFIARTPDRKPIGFLIGLRNVADPSLFLVHTLAVLPEHRQQGVGTWLVGAAHKAGLRAGYQAGVHCMAPLEGMRNMEGRVLRRYALLEKAL